MPRFNYVNSYPVTAMRYGIQTLSKKFFSSSSCANALPDIAVAGPNVGANLGLITQISGTVGAATEAAKEGVPAIAFSGSSGSQTAWNATLEPYVEIYANLSVKVTGTLTAAGGKPFLPRDVWLNVNFPAVTSTMCTEADDFKFVLSRIYPGIPLLTRDVTTCGRDILPTERSVVGMDGCFASISVGYSNKTDASAQDQAFVLKRLQGILSCLPSDD